MSTGLSILILIGSFATIVLVAVVLIRQSWGFDTAAKTVRDELKAGREEAQQAATRLREELGVGLKAGHDTLVRSLEGISALQQAQLTGMTTQIKELTESSQGGMRQVRDLLDTRVKELQEGNERKLDEMRKTVDVKLHDTLEKRLGESFKLVSDRLESVHKGLGEMQTLATGVGDLKRVLTNVKARGTWAEVQLGAILEQVLAPGQFEKNVRPVADSAETVEYAVRPVNERVAGLLRLALPLDRSVATMLLRLGSIRGDSRRLEGTTAWLERDDRQRFIARSPLPSLT